MLLRPIEWTSEGSIRLLDQRLLPSREEWVECRDFASLLSAIRDMAIRGAPALGIAAAMGLALGARDLPEDDREKFEEGFFSLVEALKRTRPTARNLFWALERMSALIRGGRHLPLPRLKQRLQEEAVALAEEDLKINQVLAEWGQMLLPQRARILTHCNAGALATGGYGTALGVIRSAWKAGKEILVYVTETRPLLQGARLTAWELAREGIPLLLITDSMAGCFMARGEIDLVLVGADRIAANGDTANKIGTYALAVLARFHGIPFYVAAPFSTFDPDREEGAQIPIEHRDEEEVKSWCGQRVAPEGVRAANPAFDITPAGFISGFITERGILYPPFAEAIAKALRRNGMILKDPSLGGKEQAVEGAKKVPEDDFPLRTWEKLVRLFPGLAGYQGRERIREADRVIRATLAEHLGLLQQRVEGVKKALAEGRDWRLLPALDLITRRMARARDIISFSRYGYSGVFDLQKVGKPELEAIYRFDLALAEGLEELGQAVEGFCARAGQGDLEADSIRLLEKALEDFSTRLTSRPGTEGKGGGG